jgi:uncharacterized protein YjbI with pentapeptide repeats
MKIEIKNRFTDAIILCGEYESIKDCLKNNRSADLHSANLRYADLRYADLSYADLRYADLRYANLSSADLSSANLSYANLRSANLSSANLSSADLSYANLSYADLSSANLSYANLSYANLRSADLSSANLSYANLRSLKNAERMDAETRILSEGDLIGWKKCHNRIIVKVLIPTDAKRSNSTSRKCRAEFVKVLEVIGGEVGISQYDSKTEYRVGEIVKCDKWNEDRWVECGGGIHFFITKFEAENY